MKGIYCYRDTENDNRIIYIGKDSYIDEDRRHKQHMQKSNYDGQVINRVLQNDNTGRYQYERMITGDFSPEELNNLEIEYIKMYDPLHNYTPGGDSLGSGEEHPNYRNDLDDNEIIDMYVNQGLNSNEIAKKLNTANNTILDRLRKNNIERRSNSGENSFFYGKTGKDSYAYRNDLKDDIIIDMYVNQGLSSTEIAKKLNTNHKTILYRLRNNNIEIRSNSGEECSNYRHDLNDDVIIDMYVNKGLNSNEIAEKLNTTSRTILNRLKKNNIERRVPVLKGKNNPFYGKTHTAEVREKLSEAHKGEKNYAWKDHPRIIKKGVNKKGKQRYALRYNGATIIQGTDKEILKHYLIRLNNGEQEERIKKEYKKLYISRRARKRTYKIPLIRKAGVYKGKIIWTIRYNRKESFKTVNRSKLEQYYFGIIFNMKYDYI